MDSSNPRNISVSVIFARPTEVWERRIDVPRGTSVEEAAKLCGLGEQLPDVNLGDLKFGIYGEVTDGSTMLSHGDRIEVYRPLLADPRVVRRELARQGRTMGSRRGNKKTGSE